MPYYSIAQIDIWGQFFRFLSIVIADIWMSSMPSDGIPTCANLISGDLCISTPYANGRQNGRLMRMKSRFHCPETITWADILTYYWDNNNESLVISQKSVFIYHHRNLTPVWGSEFEIRMWDLYPLQGIKKSETILWNFWCALNCQRMDRILDEDNLFSLHHLGNSQMNPLETSTSSECKILFK